MPQPIEGLSPYEYMHRQDAQALAAIRNTVGLEQFLRRFYEQGLDRLVDFGHTGSNLRCDDKCLPQLNAPLAEACRILGLTPQPPLYLAAGPLGAACSGVQHPVVVLNSDSVEQFSEAELLFLLGREAGRIQCGHVLYLELARMQNQIGEMVGDLTLGLGKLATAPLRSALLNWQQKASFSADRAGLLACQDLDSAMSVLAKFAGLPPKYQSGFELQPFIAQSAELELPEGDFFDRIARWLGPFGLEHSWAVMRASELRRWYDKGVYEKILARDEKVIERGRGIAGLLESAREKSSAAIKSVGEKVEQGSSRISDYATGIGSELKDSTAEALRRVQEATEDLIGRSSVLKGKAEMAAEYLKKRAGLDEEPLPPLPSEQEKKSSPPPPAPSRDEPGELRSRDDI